MTRSHGGRPAGQHVDQLYGARSLVSLSVPAARVQITVLGVILASDFNIDITSVIGGGGTQARCLTHRHSPVPSQYLAILCPSYYSMVGKHARQVLLGLIRWILL